MKRFVLLTLGIFALSTLLSAQSYWIDEDHPQRTDQQINPARYRSLRLDVNAVRGLFAEAPLEAEIGVRNSGSIISVPMPDGSMQSFRFVESPVMMPELQAQFPEIRCYTGQGITDPSATIKFDLTPRGFHGMIIRPNGTVYIDPVSPSDTEYYMSYYKKDFYATTGKTMFELPPVMPQVEADRYDQIIEDKAPKPAKGKGKPGIMGLSMKTPSGAQLRTYRLALACTGEYAQFHGGTVVLALAAMNTSMNRVNGVYEVESAIRMVLVPNNNLLVFLNGATDPYTNNDGGAMLNQNQTTCDNTIGLANYDIGHVFSTGGGGIAQLNAPCGSGRARGVTGLGAPIGDPFDIDYVCHEMGHQFGGNHTQNNSCNRATSAAYEPGSASTIMGYAGICPPNLQNNSDDYFHNHSYNEIYNFSVNGNGNTCAAISNTGNNPPTVNAGAGGWNIPISTPFELTATGSDTDGDAITFNWEQYNLGPATAAGDNTLTNPSGTAPIFRSWPATESPTRVFPRLSDLVNNTTTIGEHLPTYSRGMTFRCTVRDNRAGGGGVNDAQVSFNVTDQAGPFVVTAPNTAVTYPGNSFQTVTWNVANTTAAPVSAANVDIFLSLDGGFTYPITLVSGTPNDGSESVLIPAGQTTTARIKVKASNNIFFDISNTNFTIGPAIANVDIDAAIFGVNSPTGDNCTNNFVPEIVLGNLGQLNLTSATILYNVNGGANSSFNWTGNLATGASIAVTLPGITTPNGNNVFNVSVTDPNGTTDENLTNNAGSSIFTAISGGNTLSFTLTTDNYPEETTWQILDDNGVVLFSDGPYAQTQTTFNYSFCVGEGCYTLNVFDSFGDGMQFQGVVGNYTLTDQNGIVLAQMVAGGNFGAQATHEFCVIVDGVPGCTDLAACNYNPAAEFNDGSCDYSCYGCTNAAACNFNPAATIDNGTCIFPNGCTDPAACNYNPNATCDDGSCDFNAVVWHIDLDGDNYGTNNVVTGPLCQSPCDNTWVVNINGTGWLDETSWTLRDASNVIVLSGGGYPNTQNGGNFTVSASSANGPFTFAIETQGQFNDNVANWSVSTGSGLTLASGTITGGNTASQAGITCSFAPQGGDCNDSNPAINPGVAESPCNDIDDNCVGGIDENGIDGCTNPVACNYNANATCENGSCILPDGCTNPAACNFNPAALCDNGSCVLPDGCTDAGACNYNPAAVCDNGSCEFLSCSGCTDSNACNFDPSATIDNGTCVTPTVYYADNDGDGFGAGAPVLLCAPQAGFVANSTDCDDNNNLVYPGAPGTGEGIDNNCDGNITGDEIAGCFGDFNNDGQINIADMLFLLGDYGCTSNCVADLNGDGVVNTNDSILFLSVFGTSCN